MISAAVGSELLGAALNVAFGGGGTETPVGGGEAEFVSVESIASMGWGPEGEVASSKSDMYLDSELSHADLSD